MTQPDRRDERLADGAIGICPERDGKCHHGTACPYTIDRYRCDIAGSRAALKDPANDHH